MPAPWIDLSGHRDWLDEQARRLLDFYLSAADHVAGGFFALGRSGDPVTGVPKELWINARLIHCFALGSLLGHPGCTARNHLLLLSPQSLRLLFVRPALSGR